jgi:glycosyltransferase involved in cell wall biosynthesis
MPSSPSILVVTPTLGDSPYLDRTVESVTTQPFPILHVLSVPAPRVQTLQARFPHAHVVADAGRTGGIYGALNAALAQAPAGWDWFTYINDDDLLLPGFASAAGRHFASASGEPVIYGDVELIDEADQRLGLITVTPDPRWIPALLQEGISPLMQQGMLFHRDCVARLHRFDQRFRLCADLDFWLRACAAGERFRYYPVSVAQFRLRGGQLSGDTSLTEREQEEIVRRHLPAPLPAWRRRATRLRYRLHNLPRYLARFRTRGFLTSYALLRQTR